MNESPPLILVLMPIVVAALTAIFAGLVFRYQKTKEAEIQFRKDIQARYETYLSDMISYALDLENLEKRTAYTKSKISLRLYADKDVLSFAKELEDHISGSKPSSEPWEIAARTLNSMRTHVQGRQDLNVREMAYYNPLILRAHVR